MQQYFWDKPLSIGEKIELPKDICHQLVKVLRFNSGDNIRIVDSKGIPFLCDVEILKKKAFANIISHIEENEEPKNEIVLYLAQIKRDKFELALQKCTELGVTKIVPIITKRTVVKEHGDIEKRYLRQKAIIREAAEQSERHLIPELTMPIKLVDVETSSDNNYVCYERSEGGSEMLLSVLNKLVTGKSSYSSGSSDSNCSADSANSSGSSDSNCSADSANSLSSSDSNCSADSANSLSSSDSIYSVDSVDSLGSFDSTYSSDSLEIFDSSGSINASDSFSIIIGPEGGFEKEEIDFLVNKGFQSVSLGVQILRAETAAMLSVGLISQSIQQSDFLHSSFAVE